MGRNSVVAVLVFAMAVVIVVLDLSFFRSQTWFWERLAANVGVLLVFGAFYFRFVARLRRVSPLGVGLDGT